MATAPTLFDLNFHVCADFKQTDDSRRDQLWPRGSDTLTDFHLAGSTAAESSLDVTAYSAHLNAYCFASCSFVSSVFGCVLKYSNRLDLC